MTVNHIGVYRTVLVASGHSSKFIICIWVVFGVVYSKIANIRKDYLSIGKHVGIIIVRLGAINFIWSVFHLIR